MRNSVVVPALVIRIPADAEFPATSVALTTREFCPRFSATLQEKLEPTVAVMPLQRTVERPDKESDVLPESCALVPVVDCPFVGVSMLTIGGVLSNLIRTLADAV